MESSFKLYVVTGTEDEARRGDRWAYYTNESDAREVHHDNSSDYEGIYQLEVTVKSCSSILMTIDEFADKVSKVEDVDGAYQDYVQCEMPFDEWWTKGGKSTWSLEFDDAVAALKALMGGTP